MTKFNQPQALQDIKSPANVVPDRDNKKKGDAMIDAEERNARDLQSKDQVKSPDRGYQQEQRKVSGDR